MRYEQTAAAAAAAAAGSRHPHHSSVPVNEQSDSPLHVARSPVTATSTAHQHIDDELRDAFQVFDKDKDGFLSATDLRSVSMTSRRPTILCVKK